MSTNENKDEQTKDQVPPPEVECLQDIIGDNGRWQKNIFYFYCTISIFQAFNNLGLSLMAPKVDFWCHGADGDFRVGFELVSSCHYCPPVFYRN